MTRASGSLPEESPAIRVPGLRVKWPLTLPPNPKEFPPGQCCEEWSTVEIVDSPEVTEEAR